MASGRFYWNSGMFVWKAATIMAALEERQPEMMCAIETIVDAAGRPDFSEVFNREFAAIKGISIDYAVMEHAKEVAMIEANFRLGRRRHLAGRGAAIAGRCRGKHDCWPARRQLNTTNSIIRTDDKHLVATVGVSDLIVVHTPDATLVANRHDEESSARS